MATTTLLSAATTTGAGSAKPRDAAMCTFQARGTTSAGAGSATVQVQGSLDGVSWDTIGTITLTLGTTVTSDGFTSQDKYEFHRGNVSAISGTGAAVTLLRGA